MRFPIDGKRKLLKGITDYLTACKKISVPKLKGLLRRKAVLHSVESRRISPCSGYEVVCSIQDPVHAPTDQHTIPPQVQQLLHKYNQLFQEPSELPPLREDDNHIPVVPGAQPVNIRPYRYSPQRKPEIEKQIKEMLQSGVIQHSSSPCASPVLFVKNRDGT